MSRIDPEDQAPLAAAVVALGSDGRPLSPPAFLEPDQLAERVPSDLAGIVVLRSPHPATIASHPATIASLLTQAHADVAAAHMLIRALIADHRQETADLKDLIESQRRALQMRNRTIETLEAQLATVKADPPADAALRLADSAEWSQPNPLPRGMR